MKKLKKPNKPNEPTKPTRPDTHFSFWEHQYANLTDGSLWDVVSPVISEMMVDCDCGNLNPEELKKEFSKFQFQTECEYSDDGYYQGSTAYLAKLVTKENPNYDSEMKRYEKNLQKYNLKKKFFDEKMEIYQKELKNYETEQFLAEEQRELKLLEKLKKKYEK